MYYILGVSICIWYYLSNKLWLLDTPVAILQTVRISNGKVSGRRRAISNMKLYVFARECENLKGLQSSYFINDLRVISICIACFIS
jgi:hypothetical protein